MNTRLIRWFFFNLLFALTPLASMLVIRFLLDKLSLKAIEDNLSEILFFSIMVSVTALDDLNEIIRNFTNDALLSSIRLFLLLGAVWYVILYGFFIFDSAIDVATSLNIVGFRSKLMYASIWLATILFIVSTSAEILISRFSNINKKP